ncbi:MAG: hypothetical protein QM635_05675 [Microbacteriaceae bacterium]
MLPRTTTIVSTVTAETTDVSGRFLLRGPGFSLLTDSSLAGGGPGEAIGPLDLLVGSVVACAINVFRVAPDDGRDRRVQCFARVERSGDTADLGALVIDAVIEGLRPGGERELIEEFQQNCRIYLALRGGLDITINLHPEAPPDAPGST